MIKDFQKSALSTLLQFVRVKAAYQPHVLFFNRIRIGLLWSSSNLQNIIRYNVQASPLFQMLEHYNTSLAKLIKTSPLVDSFDPNCVYTFYAPLQLIRKL